MQAHVNSELDQSSGADGVNTVPFGSSPRGTVPRSGVLEDRAKGSALALTLRVTFDSCNDTRVGDRCLVNLIVHWLCDFPVTDWGLLREDFELPGREDFELPVRQC